MKTNHIFIFFLLCIPVILFFVFCAPSRSVVYINSEYSEIQGQCSNPNILDGNPYRPPLVQFPMGGGFVQNNYAPLSGVPLQTPTQGYPQSFQQIGILTTTSRDNGIAPLILPLLGRPVPPGRRGKFQYYTISNTGVINTKLPIKKKGRSCVSEYGCDELYSGDSVFVDGYDLEFQVTVYESSGIPYI